jgi:cobalt-zinc-cadmium efflux system protein
VPVFLQATPADTDISEIRQRLETIEAIDSVHHLHLWSLDGEHTVLTVHIVTREILNSDEYAALKRQLREVVDNLGIYHSTFEIEWPDETCRIDSHSTNCV